MKGSFFYLCVLNELVRFLWVLLYNYKRGECLVFWGLVAFILYFIYDINDITIRNRYIQKFFLLGSLVLFGRSILFLCAYDFSVCVWIFLFFACIFLALLIYTLFFALPFDETYVSQQEGRKAYSSGIYGICRHPGFWWFFFMFLFLGLALPGSGIMHFGLFCSFLNFLYICFQDFYVFPRTFVDYNEYKQRVPFLIPRRKKYAVSR